MRPGLRQPADIRVTRRRSALARPFHRGCGATELPRPPPELLDSRSLHISLVAPQALLPDAWLRELRVCGALLLRARRAAAVVPLEPRARRLHASRRAAEALRIAFALAACGDCCGVRLSGHSRALAFLLARPEISTLPTCVTSPWAIMAISGAGSSGRLAPGTCGADRSLVQTDRTAALERITSRAPAVEQFL